MSSALDQAWGGITAPAYCAVALLDNSTFSAELDLPRHSRMVGRKRALRWEKSKACGLKHENLTARFSGTGELEIKLRVGMISNTPSSSSKDTRGLWPKPRSHVQRSSRLRSVCWTFGRFKDWS